MADIAKSNIRHIDDEGKVTEIAAGGSVAGLPKEVVSDLKDQGIVGPADSAVEADTSDEVEDLKAQVEALKKEVEQAREAASAPSVPASAPKTGTSAPAK